MQNRLSARQYECLTLTRLMSDKEIAHHLNISESTVKKHVFEACQRLEVNRRKAALAKLERFVPGPTSNPIPPCSVIVPDDLVETGESNGQSATSSPVDLERSGRSNGAPDKTAGARSSQATLVEGPQRGRSDNEPGGDIARVASDSSASAGGRLGYKPPPASAFIRLVLIVVSMAVTALVFSAISSVVIRDQHRIQTAVR